MKRRRTPWLVPMAVATAIAGSIVLPATASGGQHPSLPPRSPAELVADVLSATPRPFNGMVDLTVRLGLPELPADSRTATSLNFTNFLSGSHTFEVWYRDPDHVRVALLGQLSESDVIRNGADLWTYQSALNSISHASVPQLPTSSPPSALPTMNPVTIADALISRLSPDSTLRVDSTEWVAGRPAYTLDLSPNQSGSLITSIRVSIDSATHLPLRLQIFGADRSRAAFSLGFGKIDFTDPAPSVFAFVPPSGATTTPPSPTTGGAGSISPGARPGLSFRGQGWTTIVHLTGVSVSSPLFDRSARTVPQGRLLTTSLLTVLATPDGSIYLGAVTPELLLAAQ